MKTSRFRRSTLRIAAVLAAGALVLSGCTDDNEPDEQESSSAPSAEAPDVGNGETGGSSDSGGAEAETPEEEGPPPEALDVEDKALQETAEKYITVRENQASHHHDKPTDWLGDIKKYMTTEGYQTLSEGIGPDASGGYAWNVSHDQGLAVKPRVGECVELTQASETSSDTEKTVSCSVTDIVVDKDGKNVPTNQIPATWPYVGDQQDALLEMKKDGEGWKVNMDMTGMAN